MICLITVSMDYKKIMMRILLKLHHITDVLITDVLITDVLITDVLITDVLITDVLMDLHWFPVDTSTKY